MCKQPMFLTIELSMTLTIAQANVNTVGCKIMLPHLNTHVIVDSQQVVTDQPEIWTMCH